MEAVGRQPLRDAQRIRDPKRLPGTWADDKHNGRLEEQMDQTTSAEDQQTVPETKRMRSAGSRGERRTQTRETHRSEEGEDGRPMMCKRRVHRQPAKSGRLARKKRSS